MKILIILLLLIILYCLASGSFYLVNAHASSTKLAKVLTWRTALSLALCFFLLLAYLVGWIEPHPLTAYQ